MRRAFLLLALLAAGSGGGAGAGSTAAVDRHEVASIAIADAVALGSSGAPALSGIRADGPGTAPRTSLPRADGPERTSIAPGLAERGAAFQARSTQHRCYGTALTLVRAGLLSFHTNTPPPFRLI